MDDVCQERLYCIRWRRPDGTKVYAAPNASDLKREAEVLRLLRSNADRWWRAGIIPEGATDPKVATRPRSRFALGAGRTGTIYSPRDNSRKRSTHRADDERSTGSIAVAAMLAAGRVANWNSRLCGWDSSGANEGGTQVFRIRRSIRSVQLLGAPAPKLDYRLADRRTVVKDALDCAGHNGPG